MTAPSRVAIVKSAGRADAFADAVRALGFAPVLVSPFQIEPIDGAGRAVGAALRGSRTAWLAVTSPHAVDACDGHRTGAFKVAAVGPGTAAALQSRDFDVDLVGDGGGESLAAKIVAAGLEDGGRVVHPCGEDARGELRRGIEAAGGVYVGVPVYRAVPDAVGERAAAGEFAAVVVGSPNLARRAVDLFPTRPPAVAIGRTTAAAMRDLGWPAAAVAATATPDDVVAALRRALRRNG